MKFIYTLLFLFVIKSSLASDTSKVLFLGNSYTQYNNLPEIVKDLAASSGDYLIYESNTPGGQTFQQHANNAQSLNLIQNGNWDFVVLQEQSQLPSFPDAQVETGVYPFAKTLDSLIHVANPCAKTVFYMTWGRKNGDAQNCPNFPPLCTYEGMDSLLQLRYSIMAESNNALLAPVAKVWRKIRATHPSIELYNSDESHPSPIGSFAAGLTFYSLIFQKDPVNTTYNLPNINTGDAEIIRQAVKEVVFDSMSYWTVYDHFLIADFDFENVNNTFEFENLSEEATSYIWEFGDGSTNDFSENPVHTFADNGEYQVCLTAINDCDTVVFCKDIEIGQVSINDKKESKELLVYPNPGSDKIYFKNVLREHYISLEIFNSAGQRIIAFDKNIPHEINIINWKNGIYFLRFTSKENTKKQFKLFIEN